MFARPADPANNSGIVHDRHTPMHIEATGASLGAVIHDLELATLDATRFAQLLEAWHEYAVLIFPRQHLSGEQHVAFTKRFGRLEMGLAKRVDARPLAAISNVTKEGRLARPDSLQVRFGEGNQQWHTDSSYKRVGAKASILRARQVPDRGGETEWADMRAAYEALDATTRQRLDGKVAVHSYQYSHSWHGGLELLSAAQLEHLPPVEHAVVKTHPDTGRRNLFVGRHASHIVGEDIESSRSLLKQLTADGAQPPRTCKHTWAAGDIVLWDNRCVLHRGHPWPLDQARDMVRTTVAGDAVDNEWAVPPA